ncbi:MAG: hypothetical protein MI743_09000 [Sneathiellales bacterium]|nr:hypothetical protein [Sneathiellales bacterium]
MSKIKKTLMIGGVISAALITYVAFSASSTREQINQAEQDVKIKAEKLPLASDQKTDLSHLPEPVKRYFTYVFPDGLKPEYRWAEVEMSGSFRRPQTKGFAPTTARQVVSGTDPDLVFSADTPIAGPLWAIAYDIYVNGQMEMEARLLSTLSVMHETGTPILNRISLRRWLLESPTYPFALLPGGPVTWEAVSKNKARATVRAYGEQASLIAEIDEQGRLISFAAEEDGDLTTPYHGSGEYVKRRNYQLIDGIRIPMNFEISRMAKGKIYPFWKGRIDMIRFGKN